MLYCTFTLHVTCPTVYIYSYEQIFTPQQRKAGILVCLLAQSSRTGAKQSLRLVFGLLK